VALVFLLGSGSQAAVYSLAIAADHGSVTITPDKTTYNEGETVELMPRPDTGYCFTGWGGDAHGKKLVLNLTMDDNKTITANFSIWQPPIGIPDPEFGIHETHRMYEGQTYDFGSGPQPYRDAGNGPYTHYVDGTDPNATDSENPYGTASKPRETLPDAVGAGTVIEVHGGPYAYANAGNKITIEGNGTADRPVFIRGADSPPEFRRTVDLIGQYMILEGFSLYNADLVIGIPTGYDYSGTLNHISIRGCEIEGDGTTDSEGGTGSVGADHVVIYNNHVHHFGDYAYSGENDRHGVVVGPYSHYIWVVDNHIHHNGGDSFQTGHGAGYTVSHVYIGRNVMHDDGENAVDLKEVTDVIVSENTMYSYPFRNDSSDGTITVTHYGPSLGTQRAWFIANEMYDADLAANQVSSGPEDIYYIGNVIHDIQGLALFAWSHEDVYFINNTLYNLGGGIDDTETGSATATIVNNIFGALTSPSGNHITLEYADYLNNAVVSNNLFQDPMNANTTCDDCLEGDPGFTDANNLDFSLQVTSPAIDRGISSGVVQEVLDRFQLLYGIDIAKDIQGQTRPLGGEWDIGAYECRGVSRVHRFWSPTYQKHFYTISEAEKNHVISTYPASVWTYETVAYRAFVDDGQGVSPVYRFWSPLYGAHFYTIDEDEKDAVIDTYASNIWTFEGPVFYAYPEGAQPDGTRPVHRFWSDSLGGHFYTVSEAEKNSVIADYPDVWTYEGIAWYVYEP
jgi:uncharacterized repeat protein (TIGR02543 family)